MTHYIEFPYSDYARLSPWAREQTFKAYREWLEENIGEQRVNWDYETGDLCARGLFLPTPGDVIAFKLKFRV